MHDRLRGAGEPQSVRLHEPTGVIMSRPIAILILLICMLSCFRTAGQVLPSNSQVMNNNLSVSFSDSLTGWIAGSYDILMHTIDGGATWAKDPLCTTTYHSGFYSIEVARDQDTWLVWGTSGYSYVSHRKGAGLNWDTVLVSWTGHNQSVAWKEAVSLDSSSAWVICTASPLYLGIIPFLETVDGGKSWTEAGLQLYGGDNTYTDISVTSQHVFVLHNGSIVWRSVTGSRVWEADTISADRHWFKSMSFATPTCGWICGNSGHTLHTSDGGVNWYRDSIDTDQDLTSIYAIDSTHVWTIGSGGTVFGTSNGGRTWQTFLFAEKHLNSLCFPDINHGWIVGDSGVVIQYLSGSITHIPANESATYSIELKPNYPNPFNPHTTFRFVLPTAMYIILTVCDVLGRDVANLASSYLGPGEHQIAWDASGCASGVYVCRLQTRSAVLARKILLLR
jgi:photosystem II stability/assembly factor-like uncharacterized protein